MTSSDDRAPDRAPDWAPEQVSQEVPPPQEPSPGVQFNPQSAYPSYQSQPQHGQYGQPQYAQYGQPAYGQPQFAMPYPTWPGYGPPAHPKTDLALILGLIGGPVAVVTCGLSLLVAPFAWYFAALVRRETAAAPGRYSADNSKVTAALVLGIIGTALLALAFVLVAFVIITIIADPGAFDSGTIV